MLDDAIRLAMSLLTLAIVLVLAGLLLWAVGEFIPMDPKVHTLLRVVVVVALVLWVLSGFGVISTGIRLR